MPNKKLDFKKKFTLLYGDCDKYVLGIMVVISIWIKQ
jgi:hypothetical protein